MKFPVVASNTPPGETGSDVSVFEDSKRKLKLLLMYSYLNVACGKSFFGLSNVLSVGLVCLQDALDSMGKAEIKCRETVL